MPIGSPQQVVPSGHCDVNIRVQRNGSARPFTFGFGLAIAPFDLATLQAIALDEEAAFVSNMLPLLADSYVYVGTEVRGSPDDGSFVVVESGASAGGDAADTITSNTAILIEKRTAVAGRQNQGRMFVPGLAPEASVGDGGGIETGARAAIQVAVDGWFDDIDSIGAVDDVVIFHSDFIRNPAVDKDDTANPAYRIANPNAGTPTVVTSFTVDPIVATQRRRMR